MLLVLRRILSAISVPYLGSMAGLGPDAQEVAIAAT
jgi:hypothetical protein